MGKVISFEERAVANLRDRLGAAESANEDLIAFARGHSGATAAIHGAVLSLMEADSLQELFKVVRQDWPRQLGLDHAAVRARWEDVFVEPAVALSRTLPALGWQVRLLAGDADAGDWLRRQDPSVPRTDHDAGNPMPAAG